MSGTDSKTDPNCEMTTETFRRIPWSIIVSVAGLTVMGLSAMARGDELYGGNYYERQFLWGVLGMGAFAVAAMFEYRALKPVSLPGYLLTIGLLVLVFLFPAIQGAHRWIPLGVLNIQPSELAKIAFILALSHYLMYRKNYRQWWGLLIPFAMALIPVVLILKEPDLGTAMLFLPVLFAMLYAAGARTPHLVMVIALGVLALPVLWTGMNVEQKSRVTALFTQQDGGPTPRGDGYHLHQSKKMLATSGMWGSFASEDVELQVETVHLPAARTDFVFCLVGERWGAMGCLVMFGMYFAIIARGLAISLSTDEPFGRLIVTGVVALIAAQCIINTGMTVGLMPITGLTLPLVSYGGSSMLATCVGLGLIVNVAMRPGYEITGEPFRFDHGRV